MTACIEAHPSSSKAVFRNDGYDFAKLAACFFMAINHLTLHMGKVPALQGFLVSRMVMPIFAFILVSRLMEDFDGRNLRLQRNLLFWGTISQVPYTYFNRANHFTTNILLDFWAGVVLIALSRKFGFRARVPLIVPRPAAHRDLQFIFWLHRRAPHRHADRLLVRSEEQSPGCSSHPGRRRSWPTTSSCSNPPSKFQRPCASSWRFPC